MIVILAYHSVAPLDYLYSVYPDTFKKQLIFLKKRFKVISLKELLFLLQNKSEDIVKKKLAVITFDDGLQDNFLNAFPILKELNLPSVVFVSTLFAGRKKTNDDGYTFKFISWEEMKEASKGGLVEFQNHTHSHPILTELTNDKINEEFSVSKRLLEENLGNKVYAVAFPKGKCDERVIKLSKKYFDIGFADGGVITNINKTNPFKMPRVNITSKTSLIKFKIMLSRYFWEIKKFKDKKLFNV